MVTEADREKARELLSRFIDPVFDEVRVGRKALEGIIAHALADVRAEGRASSLSDLGQEWEELTPCVDWTHREVKTLSDEA